VKISALAEGELAARMRDEGVCLRTGPFVTQLRSAIDDVARDIHTLYGNYELQDRSGFIDFDIRLIRPRGPRRWWRPQVQFMFDGGIPFKPLPLSQAFPMFEWGLNWCIASNMHRYLLLHAAVVARDDRAMILPGQPGSGKSTLCAALVSRGWRLLSDEMGVVVPASGELLPVPRPVSLKNESIDVIRAFAPAAVIGRSWEDTRKGTVAHMGAPENSVLEERMAAVPYCVVAPKYSRDGGIQINAESKAQMFMYLAKNSFNYHVLGPQGFVALGRVIDRCACYHLTFNDLAGAVATIEDLPLGPS
jgi:HprK-related kinase A